MVVRSHKAPDRCPSHRSILNQIWLGFAFLRPGRIWPKTSSQWKKQLKCHKPSAVFAAPLRFFFDHSSFILRSFLTYEFRPAWSNFLIRCNTFGPFHGFRCLYLQHIFINYSHSHTPRMRSRMCLWVVDIRAVKPLHVVEFRPYFSYECFNFNHTFTN